jgi:plastocyanin
MKVCRAIGLLLSVALIGLSAVAAAAEVTAQVSVSRANGHPSPTRDTRVVLWLTPALPRLPAQFDSTAPHAVLVQRNKAFEPHVAAVQVGSQVEFPNRDPFFHNVFSLFNGKRFDLGLYEAGSTRSVRFDRAGVCYIFCNIHPQMSAVVVVVDTPFFAISDPNGEVVVPRVPAGEYVLNLWEERCSQQALKQYSRQVTVGENSLTLGSIQLQESESPVTAHLNKYGKQYDPDVFSSPLYLHP